MDGQSLKTTERGGIRGFDAHKRVKGRKRHILVDTFGLLIACRVEPADISDRKAAALLLGGLRPLFPNIRTVIADAGRAACPSVVIMDGQSVKTTERGGARGFDAHKRVKGRKRHILVDTLGLLVANRVEPADTSDRRAGALLLGGLSALFPRIRTIIADAGHESRKLARTLKQHQGWQLRIVKRRQRAFKITGLTWIVERSFAWLGRNRRLSKDYEYRVQTSETMIDLASIRLMLNRIAPV